jgi:hypothetical protein
VAGGPPAAAARAAARGPRVGRSLLGCRGARAALARYCTMRSASCLCYASFGRVAAGCGAVNAVEHKPRLSRHEPPHVTKASDDVMGFIVRPVRLQKKRRRPGTTHQLPAACARRRRRRRPCSRAIPPPPVCTARPRAWPPRASLAFIRFRPLRACADGSISTPRARAAPPLRAAPPPCRLLAASAGGPRLFVSTAGSWRAAARSCGWRRSPTRRGDPVPPSRARQ